MTTPSATQTTTSANPLIRLWGRLSRRLLPVFAVLSALILTIPFMVITGAQGDVGRGLNIAFTAYSAFIEGSVGLAFNNMLRLEDTALVLQLASAEAEEGDILRESDLRAFRRRLTPLVEFGQEEILAINATLNAFSDRLTPAEIDALGERIPAIRQVGMEQLRAMQPFTDLLATYPSGDVARMVRTYAPLDLITDDDRAAINAVTPIPDDIDNNTLLSYLRTISSQGTVRTIQILQEQADVLESLGLDPNDTEAFHLANVSSFATGTSTGSQVVRDLAAVSRRLTASGITDQVALARQITLVDSLYSFPNCVLSDPNVAQALTNELPPFLENNFVVYRPGNQPVMINRGTTDNIGSISVRPAVSGSRCPITETTFRDDVEPRLDSLYVRIGDRALVFFPGNLERMLTRSIPFIIAGLAVALGFKAGLFNIGAEGQLYMGAILGVWVGFSPLFDFLPGQSRMLGVLVAGVIGGGLWGMIPGALKAFTGAHEVINTIMLNFVAIKLVEWLIRSREPFILRDPAASVDQTPNVVPDAVLPRFNQIDPALFVLAGALVAAFGLWRVRNRLRDVPTLAIRPVIYGALTVAAGFFFAWLNIRGDLHIGLAFMVLAVILTDWFLRRTTPGFELQTVGANPNAARYAGMNVKWNIILAMSFAGALAGFAGAIEIAGVQYNMKPAFFAGLGFEAIAVALLARSNPRYMIPAGLLWGALTAGAGLMQVRADIAIDLVKIIQALIIMFIAADVIVRWLWRVPPATEEEKSVSTFSKGWGG